MTNILYLASKSKSRQRLLKEAGINFEIIDQNADERSLSWDRPLKELLEIIAIFKMDNIIIPNNLNQENNIIFVLTADTMGVDQNGKIFGKPENKQDAINKIKAYRNGAQTATAFCLDRKIFKNNKWKLEERIINFVSAKYIFDIPDNWIERYFELSLASGINYLQVSGAVAVEEFGAQFLKSVDGSYTTIVGLPMYELREALSKIGFFK
jgi:septum formation protein